MFANSQGPIPGIDFAFPDVCLTPMPAPVPIPYPNFGFSPIALGIGGGYLVIGQVKQVEQALRSVDAKGEAGLAGDAQYAAAVKAMSKDPVVATVWWNTPRMMESAGRTMKAAAAQIEAMGGGEDAEIPGVGLGVKDVFSFYDLLKPDVVKRCFGDTVLDFKATNAGFSTSLRALPGTGK